MNSWFHKSWFNEKWLDIPKVTILLEIYMHLFFTKKHTKWDKRGIVQKLKYSNNSEHLQTIVATNASRYDTLRCPKKKSSGLQGKFHTPPVVWIIRWPICYTNHGGRSPIQENDVLLTVFHALWHIFSTVKQPNPYKEKQAFLCFFFKVCYLIKISIWTFEEGNNVQNVVSNLRISRSNTSTPHFVRTDSWNASKARSNVAWEATFGRKGIVLPCHPVQDRIPFCTSIYIYIYINKYTSR